MAVVATLMACKPSVRFSPADFGEPGSGARIEVYRPAGAGPFAAIVVLHPCNGVARGTRVWAERLREWGYLAAVVDSFGPRGVRSVCSDGDLVTERERAADGFGAAATITSREDVRRDRIAILGLSHGASGVIAAATEGTGSPAFRAAVALYPWCLWRTVDLQTETLVLIGEADDWTPASRCRRFVQHEIAAGQRISLKTYPGALHGFDSGAPIHDVLGHQVGGDPAAAADAFARIRTFLAMHLPE